MVRFALLAVLLYGCQEQVLRDRDVYVAEVTFTDRLLREGAPAVRELVLHRCACTNNVWRSTVSGLTDSTCLNYVEWWMVYTSRWRWHHDMMLYNARLRDARPPAAPVIPRVECYLPTFHAE